MLFVELRKKTVNCYNGRAGEGCNQGRKML